MNITSSLRKRLHDDIDEKGITVLIILWAALLIYLAITIKNKWVKAGILAWEILP